MKLTEKIKKNNLKESKKLVKDFLLFGVCKSYHDEDGKIKRIDPLNDKVK